MEKEKSLEQYDLIVEGSRLAFNSTQLNQCLWWIDIEISQHQRSGVDQPASHIEWN
jgi:hypothetical protein